MRTSTTNKLIASSVLLFCAAASQAQNGPDTLWEISSKISIDGMTMPAMPHKVCVKGTQPHASGPDDKNCKTSDVKTSGNRTTYRVNCTGKDAMSGTGEMTTGKDSYSGKLKLAGKVDGDDATMLTEYTGKRIGKCTAK